MRRPGLTAAKPISSYPLYLFTHCESRLTHTQCVIAPVSSYQQRRLQPLAGNRYYKYCLKHALVILTVRPPDGWLQDIALYEAFSMWRCILFELATRQIFCIVEKKQDLHLSFFTFCIWLIYCFQR